MNVFPDYMEDVVLTATPKPTFNPDPVKVTHADYRCMVGSRRQNTLLANAGLGVTGAFEPITYTIDWKPGEVVDVARAEKLVPVLLQGLNDTETECTSVELIRIYQ